MIALIRWFQGILGMLAFMVFLGWVYFQAPVIFYIVIAGLVGVMIWGTYLDARDKD